MKKNIMKVENNMTEREIILTQEIENYSQTLKEIADLCHNDTYSDFEKIEIILNEILIDW